MLLFNKKEKDSRALEFGNHYRMCEWRKTTMFDAII